MNREIILRVKGPEGQYRITIGARDTYGVIESAEQETGLGAEGYGHLQGG